MTREEYARNFSSGHARNGGPVIVPPDVERVSVHEPCWMCGEARGLCKHRRAAA
jgi:hypothetical protein